MNKATQRKPEGLVSVGPAIRRDFTLLGINIVAQLARRDPGALYQKLCRKTKTRQDICVLDRSRLIQEWIQTSQ